MVAEMFRRHYDIDHRQGAGHQRSRCSQADYEDARGRITSSYRRAQSGTLGGVEMSQSLPRNCKPSLPTIEDIEAELSKRKNT